MFDSIGQWAADVLGALGSIGLLFLMVAENLFPPIPSEAILPLAGFLVGRGELGGVQAILAATAGSVLGAFFLYALGRWGGRAVVLRYGRVLRVTENDLDRAEGWFERYGDAVVLFGRMVPLGRSVVSIPAGMLKMPVWRFTLLTTIGSALWNMLLVGAGWFLGANWERVSAIVGSISNAVFLIALVVVVTLAIYWFRRPRRRR
ncbi:MAG TPA: DedA family protein [Rubrobacteraceae bacterium]|nr:DedA family protein [Rubrobacteraceae bacterium]